MVAGVRELTRDAVRTRLAEAVYDRFLADGFDETTVEEAAQAGGVSRATFFRYFRSKEDAVIVALESASPDFASALRSAGDPRGSVLKQLRAAFEPAVVAAEADPVRVRSKARMITSIPSLGAHLAERRLTQEGLLVEALADRVDDPLTARVLVVAALGAFDLAWREWARGADGSSFRELLDAVFERLSAAASASASASE